MRRVRFPEPVTFDTFGRHGSIGCARKVLEEAAELVEAVKGYEKARGSGNGAVRAHAEGRVLDEAMDVYQAVANFAIVRTSYVVDGLHPGISKANALDVLCAAARLFYETEREWPPDPDYRFNGNGVVWVLAKLMGGSFTDGEIAEAYDRCVERNRERGRIA